jgi:glucokinase
LSHLLGIDIGGTSIKIGLVRTDGQIIDRLVFPTQSLESVEHFFVVLSEQIARLQARQEPYQRDLLGVGIGAPGHSLDSGVIIDAVNLPFKESIAIGSFLEQHLQVPSFLIKDSKAAALGEKYWGSGRSATNFVLLMLGTGLGYAACCDGKIVNGNHGLAGELGHIIFEMDGRSCNCGKKGCLETYLSATGLKRTAFELLGTSNKESPLRDYSFQNLNSKIIAQLARAGDPVAKAAFEITGKYLGIQMANLTEQLTPSLFIIAGGLAEAGSLLLEPARQSLLKNIQPVYRDYINITTSTLGASEVGILGAAALALDNIILQS